MRQLLEPLAKILCTEKYNLEEFKKKIPNGYGEYDFSDGTSYKGEWKDGEYHGQGIFSDSTGDDKYKGKWKNGKMHGQGIRTYYDGVQKRKLKGEFKDNRLHGLGSKKKIGSVLVIGRMGNCMAKELSQTLWETSMKGNSRMGENMGTE